MITLPAKYEAAASPQHIVADWLLELAYDDTTPGTFYMSAAERTVTNFYDGIVLSWGQIDEKLNLANSSASVSDIKITVANKWNNASGLLSAELFGGTKKFINQDVVIRSWLLGCAVTADCLILYKGRLVDIQHDIETVTFTIEKRSPWDRVKFPTTYSTKKKILFPSVYGDFTRNVSTAAEPDFCDSKALFPTPVNEVSGSSLVCLLSEAISPIEENSHFYDKSVDLFLPLDPVNELSRPYEGGQVIDAITSLKRGADVRPASIIDGGSDFTDTENAFDGDTATYAYVEFNQVSPGTTSYKLQLNMPTLDGKLQTTGTVLRLFVKYLISLDNGSTETIQTTLDLNDYTFGAPITFAYSLTGNTVPNTAIGNITSTLTHGVSGYGARNWNTAYLSDNNKMPDTLDLRFDLVTSSANIAIGSCKIYDIYFRQTTDLDFENEPESSNNFIATIDKMYNGTDGLGQGFTDGSGVASYPLDIYRDMLNRYAGWDATGGLDEVTVNGTAWSESSIDADRNWDCRWWTLKQLILLTTLAQLQFEGAFIWVFDETSPGVEARVIYVKSSYAAGDIDATLDGEYLDAKVALSPFSEIVTKRTFNYPRHPADEKRYLGSNYKINANRDDYNLETEENAIDQDLDFLTATADVDDLLTYYDNIVGEAKIIVVAELLDPSTWNLQVGDIVKLDNMSYEPYGKAWADLYLMIVSVKIGVDKYIMTAREVG